MPITVPVTFVDGNFLYASQLNACFAALAVAYDAGGDTLTGNMNAGLYQILNMKFEVLVSDPSTGNEGRVWYDSTDKVVKYDNGTAVKEFSIIGHTHLGPTSLATDPDEADLLEGELWYNSTDDVLKLATVDASAADVQEISTVGHTHADYIITARNDFRVILSGTDLTLDPMTGVQINIDGTMRAATGLPVIARSKLKSDGTGTTGASTLYYLYAYWGTDLELEASATAPAAAKDAGGRLNMTGDTTKRLVGMAYTDSSGYWVNSAKQRFVLSYAHRRPLSGAGPLLDNRVLTMAATYAEVHTDARVEFLTWDDEIVQACATGGFYSNGTAGNCSFIIRLTSTVPSTTDLDGAQSKILNQSAGAYDYLIGFTASPQLVTRGKYIISLFTKIDSGTPDLTFRGAAAAPDRTVLSLIVQG